MRWLRKIGIIALLVAIVWTPTVSSYSVSPARWEFYQDYEITPQTRVSIYVDNDGNNSISIRLSVRTDLKQKEGYESLPTENWSWIKFQETDFTVPAHSKYAVPATVDVPNVTENYNRSWFFYIFVDQYAGGDTNGTTQFQYDYNLLWTIKTPLRYVPPNERPKQAGIDLPWLYIGIIGISAVGIAIGIALMRRYKPGKKYEEEDIFK